LIATGCITAPRRVVFVMRGGRVYRNETTARPRWKGA